MMIVYDTKLMHYHITVMCYITIGFLPSHTWPKPFPPPAQVINAFDGRWRPCACARARTRVRTRVRACVRARACARVCVCACLRARSCVRARVRARACACLRACVCMPLRSEQGPISQGLRNAL